MISRSASRWAASPRPLEGEDPDLPLGGSGGPYRTGAVGVLRAQFLGGSVRFVVTGSGHIAGVEPAGTEPVSVLDRGPPVGELETWLEAAEEHPGSWWPDWQAWSEAQDRGGSRPGRSAGASSPHRGCAGQLCSGEELSTGCCQHYCQLRRSGCFGRSHCHRASFKHSIRMPQGIVQEPQWAMP